MAACSKQAFFAEGTPPGFVAKLTLLASVLILAVGPAAGSLIETTSGGAVTYQFDAETFHDAPDTCEGVLGAIESFAVPMDGSADGIVVPVEDEVDHFILTVAPEVVGDRVFVSVGTPVMSVELSLDVQVPGCGTSVVAAENQPVPESERPAHPAAAEGEKQVSPSSLKDGSPEACGGDDWRFVLNQFHDLAPPAALHGIWSDGTQADIPLLKSTDATMAFYATDYNTGIRLKSVIANVPEAWSGQFNSVHGPCGAVEGNGDQIVYGPANTKTQTSVAFTPVSAGDHVVSIRLLPPEVPTSITLSCHYCVAGTDGLAESASYITSASKQTN